MKLEFDKLYLMCGDKECLVSNRWVEDNWRVKFSRAFRVEDMLLEWENLISLLENFRLNEEEDKLFGFWRTWVHISRFMVYMAR